MDRLNKDIQLRILRDAFFADFAGVCMANEEEIPKSLHVPEMPRPEVYIPVRDTPQVPFDPVPRGIREGLDAVSSAGVASLVSEPFKSLAQDDALWEAPLSALEKAFEAGDHNPKVHKYVDPRHTEAWPELSAFDKYGKLLAHIQVLSVDFLKACARDVGWFANVFTYGRKSYAQHIYGNPYPHGLAYGEKEPPENWWEEVFTDPVIQRILWNTYADRMRRGATTIDFWKILIAGSMNFERGTGFRKRTGMYYTAMRKDFWPKFWEALIGGAMNLEQATGFRELMYDNAIEELVEQGYLLWLSFSSSYNSDSDNSEFYQ